GGGGRRDGAALRTEVGRIAGEGRGANSRHVRRAASPNGTGGTRQNGTRVRRRDCSPPVSERAGRARDRRSPHVNVQLVGQERSSTFRNAGLARLCRWG